MASEPPATFGDRLRGFRTAAGLTQESLAERAGLSARGISDLERDRRASPYYDTVQRLADALELTAEDHAILLAAARPRDRVDVPVATTDPWGNFPVPLTSLIGRADDRRAVCQLLDQPDVRLVTLTGPGGSGHCATRSPGVTTSSLLRDSGCCAGLPSSSAAGRWNTLRRCAG